MLRKQIKEDLRELAFCLVAFRPWVQGQILDPDRANLVLEPVNVQNGVTIVVSLPLASALRPG